MQHRSRNARKPAALSSDLLERIGRAFSATQAESGGQRAALQTCIEQLPGHSREILALRYEQNIKGAQIAARLQMTLAAIHKTLSRLCSALEECVGRKLPERMGKGVDAGVPMEGPEGHARGMAGSDGRA